MTQKVTRAWVRRRAKELGIQADDELLERILQRVRMYRQAEETLDRLDLREVAPAPVFQVEEGRDG